MIAARFANGGRTVAALGVMDRKLSRWDAATASPLPAIDLGAVLKADEVPFRFHVDAPGALGLVASQNALHLVPLDGRSPPRVIPAPEAGGGAFGNVADVALAPDGASACAIDVANRIHCYRTSNGQLIASLTYELDIKLQSIAILGNGALAAGTAESQVARWKSTKGDYVDTSGFDHQSPANAVAAFPSQIFFALGRYDGKIHILSPDLGNRGPRIELLGAKGPVGMMAISPTGQLAAAAGHEIIVWDIGAELIRLGAKP
jgi:WD40 repeat protein